jgi:hypothetical protein
MCGFLHLAVFLVNPQAPATYSESKGKTERFERDFRLPTGQTEVR